MNNDLKINYTEFEVNYRRHDLTEPYESNIFLLHEELLSLAKNGHIAEVIYALDHVSRKSAVCNYYTEKNEIMSFLADKREGLYYSDHILVVALEIGSLRVFRNPAQYVCLGEGMITDCNVGEIFYPKFPKELLEMIKRKLYYYFVFHDGSNAYMLQKA